MLKINCTRKNVYYYFIVSLHLCNLSNQEKKEKRIGTNNIMIIAVMEGNCI